MIGMMEWRIPEQGWRKGPWTNAEDKLLIEYVTMHGEGRWSSVASCTGLNRSGKSCRLRWVNYLRPGLKKGRLTPQEEGIIIELHALWGNKWSTIARYLPGRTDNEIKNYWRTHFKNKRRPSQNQKIKQKRTSLRLNQHQQDNDMMDNRILVPHAEANIKDIATEPQSKQEPLFLSTSPITSNIEQQNHSDIAASWWDSLTEDGLWSGFLWNLDIDRLCGDYNTAGASPTNRVHTNEAMTELVQWTVPPHMPSTSNAVEAASYRTKDQY